MKLLTKIKLINWHYFWNESIEIKPIVFLTGLNGSGKSTLIDAFEVVLLGDTTGRSFNKAALEKSARTLKGYLRGELGDILDGGFKYLRNGRFTSYIALEFHDDVEEKDFTLGIVFDSFEDGSEEHRFFNIGDKIPENDFIVNNVPLSYKDLNKFLLENYPKKYRFFDSNKQYQEFLKKKMGGLKDKYFSLLKKATSFSPITDITTFITDYVCDAQQNLDLTHLQDNIVQYRKLQVESDNIKKRIEKLEEIEGVFAKYKTYQKDFLVNSYLIEKCELYNSESKLEAYKKEIEKSTLRVNEIESELEDFKDTVDELEKRKVQLISDKMNNDVAKITSELYENKKEIEGKIKEIQEDVESFKTSISEYIDSYSLEANRLLVELEKIDKDLLDEDKDNEISEILLSSRDVIEAGIRLNSKLNNDPYSVNKDDLLEFRSVLSNFKENVSTLAISLARTIANLDKKISSLKEEELNMKKGTKPFDYRLISIKNSLKDELRIKFNKEIEVELYCDLIDIKDLSWSNAIEGYLFAQKFNLFVAPKYYLDAYKILKRLLEENRYYGTALVDQENIIKRNYQYESDSLASEVETDHEGARAYTNFLIGRLFKAENLEEARDSGNGITRECDLYRNFAMSRINPRTYSESFVGTNVNKRFLDEKAKQLEGSIKNLQFFREIKNLINSANNLELISSGEIEHLLSLISRNGELNGLKKSLSYVETELQEHDTVLIASLDKRIDDVNEDLKEITKDRDDLILEKGNLLKEIENLKNDKIVNEEKAISERKESLSVKYDDDLINEASALFDTKINENKSYFDVLTEANSSLSRLQYLYNNVFSSLVTLRRDYVHEYHLSYDVDSKLNDEFNKELIDFRDVRLPDYLEKINDAYSKATHQFKDDFIFKLRGAIEDVEDQIDNLNLALEQSSFGRDSYRFTCKPSGELKRYYDMLKDDLILDCGEDETKFIDKYKDVMEDLFKQIVDINENGRDQDSKLLENIERFTDYRSYLDFDLIVYNKDTKEEQRLSKMIKKKSGGETQTPFYIAVLASFAQLYHVHDEGEIANTSRLIIFDEAFSKMDRGRIKEAVRLLRKFNLQVIISCPTDKVADITELVDETLVVLHKNNSSCVRNFSKADL